MVDLTRQLIHVITLQAGPGEAESHVINVRLREAALRALGRRLASIGDSQHQEWTSKYRQSALLHLLRPAQALIRAILRDIHSQVWELMSRSAKVKAWFLNTVTEQTGFQPQNWMHFFPVMGPGWTTGAAATAALFALSSLWIVET